MGLTAQVSMSVNTMVPMAAESMTMAVIVVARAMTMEVAMLARALTMEVANVAKLMTMAVVVAIAMIMALTTLMVAKASTIPRVVVKVQYNGASNVLQIIAHISNCVVCTLPLSHMVPTASVTPICLRLFLSAATVSAATVSKILHSSSLRVSLNQRLRVPLNQCLRMGSNAASISLSNSKVHHIIVAWKFQEEASLFLGRIYRSFPASFQFGS